MKAILALTFTFLFAITLPAQAISEEVLIEKYAKGDERSIDDVRRRVARAITSRRSHAATISCPRISIEPGAAGT